MLIFVLEQGGTNDAEELNASVMVTDGSVVLAGWTLGNWDGTNAGSYDCAAVKLDVDGNVLWKWQVR